MNTIHHVFDVHKPRSKVYLALATEAGLAGWWSTLVGAEQRVGGVVKFTFAQDFNPDMEITAMVEGRSLEWRCVSGHQPWAENTFRFELGITRAEPEFDSGSITPPNWMTTATAFTTSTGATTWKACASSVRPEQVSRLTPRPGSAAAGRTGQGCPRCTPIRHPMEEPVLDVASRR